ncbi:MAG: NFACT family protein, partial [Bacilli bacterium]|nr:NFACT family protein [Bacilli bacterium]
IMDEVHRGDSYFDYYGEKIKINETFTPSQNLNALYKTYKKAKLTLQSTDNYIQKTEYEIDYLNSIFNSLQFFNETDYEELIPELIDKKLLKQKNKKHPKNLKNAAKPYYLMHNGIKFGFGKNSLQNDNLTWNYASKNDYFLHTKNEHGNHVIIFSNILTDEILEFGLELCAFLTGHNDGEIILAKCTTIKKGSEPGLVKLSSYESYTIKNLKHDFASLIKDAKRF